MAANYNNAAWFYDRLSGLVYGSAIIDAQVYLLQFIPAGASVLIAGGGTGRILEEICKIHPEGLTITYVEVSANMTTLSKARYIGSNQVVFINDAIENVKLADGFNVIITPFLFDNFVETTLHKVFIHLHAGLKKDGLWLNCDFQLTGRWWQNILLRSMFLFFRILCKIEASKLPAIDAIFNRYGYQPINQKTFFQDFISSKVYSKIE